MSIGVSLKLFPFTRIIVVGSPQGPMICLVTGSLTRHQCQMSIMLYIGSRQGLVLWLRLVLNSWKTFCLSLSSAGLHLQATVPDFVSQSCCIYVPCHPPLSQQSHPPPYAMSISHVPRSAWNNCNGERTKYLIQELTQV